MSFEGPVRFGVARAGGIGRSELDRAWAAPHWGIRVRELDDSLMARCRALVPRLPAGFAFSHATAAMLMGLPLPRRLEIDEIHVALQAGHRAIDASGVVGHELRLNVHDRAELDGLPITSPARTFRDLAPHLSVADLIAVGDAMIHRSAPLVGYETLAALTVARRRYRGRRRAIEAIPRLSDRAESRPESLLRIALEDAGLPSMLVNEDVHVNGRFIARPDIRFEHFALVVEYDGTQHATDPVQWRKDVARFEALKDAGLDYVRATSDDLPAFDTTVRRTIRALRRLGWR